MSRIIEITDFTAPELNVYARMTEVQLKNNERPEDGIFIAESPIVIERALNAGYEAISFLMEKKHIETVGKCLIERCGDIPVFTAEFDVLSRLTGFKLTRGMLCAMRRKPLPSINDLCRNANRIAVLISVMNPTNVGAIIRSAAALGIDALIITNDSSDPLYRRAIRVSMGTVFQIPWTVSDCDILSELSRCGFKTAAMALTENSVSIKDDKLNNEEKLAIILGSEGYGLPNEVIDKCDYKVKIPMSHGVDSLNVAAASAVAFYQLGN